jgi:hypothetical protein
MAGMSDEEIKMALAGDLRGGEVHSSAAADVTGRSAEPGPSMDAHQDRENRMNADIATMQAGPTEHAASQTDHHQGQPSAAVQQETHGQPAPRTPDTGGRG